MHANEASFQSVREHAIQANSWFTDEHIGIAAANICQAFLDREKLVNWMAQYKPVEHPVTVGITMAGNIPMVGFHDFLCAYLSGNHVRVRYSSKDAVLIPHMMEVIPDTDPDIRSQIVSAEQLKGCDAYIATGSNNSARYLNKYLEISAVSPP
ncbi:MAG: hypothetical protein QM743_07510 [Chitinophagaceae bacterium]